jgi:ATP-dependent Clp protease ATP-binding subunit ClpC
MFERYTEKARRVIFFARYEAAAVGSPFIEPPHLLLGIVREAKSVLQDSPRDAQSIRHVIEAGVQKRQATSTSVDLPLNVQAKQALAFAAEEAERCGHKHIGSEHLLLGLIRIDRALVQNAVGFTDQQMDALRDRVATGTLRDTEPGASIPASSYGTRGLRPERQAVLHAVIQALLEPQVTIQITTPSGTQTFSFEPGRAE